MPDSRAQPIAEMLVDLIHAKAVTASDRHSAARLLVDAAANIVAGLNSDPGRRFIAWAQNTGLIGADGTLRDRPDQFALLLGSLCHIHEVDDLHRASVVHPGCVVAPVLWAQRSRAPDPASASKPDDPLRDFIHGVEATTRVGMAIGPAHYKIWHNTATCGPFGAVFAAAGPLGLSRGQLINAIGNAGTQGAGLWEFLESGAMTKHLHAGRAAQAGLVSAEMAVCGITGPATILEGPKGFFAAMSGDGDVTRVCENPDGPWQVHETSIKPWPSCRHTHPAIEAAGQIRAKFRAENRSPDHIRGIHIQTYEAARALCDRPVPDTAYSAKFSLQHCVAAALTEDRPDFSSFDAAHRTSLALLREKTDIDISPVYEDCYPASWGSAVAVTFADGHSMRVERDQALGDPDHAISDDALFAKAERLLVHGGHLEPGQLITNIMAMVDGAPLPDLGLAEILREGRNKRPHAERAA